MTEQSNNALTFSQVLNAQKLSADDVEIIDSLLNERNEIQLSFHLRSWLAFFYPSAWRRRYHDPTERNVCQQSVMGGVLILELRFWLFAVVTRQGRDTTVDARKLRQDEKPSAVRLFRPRGNAGVRDWKFHRRVLLLIRLDPIGETVSEKY